MDTGEIMIFDGVGQPFRSERRSLPALAPGEVLVRNLYTTICGSDLHTYCGVRNEQTPTVLGHEIVGQIVRIGPGHSNKDYSGGVVRPGDRITWCVFRSDPRSVLSLEGIPQKGDGLFKYGHAQVTATDAFHGGLSEYSILRQDTAMLKLSDTLPLPIAATINCSVSTVAGMLRLAGPVSGRHVWISGMGMLGVTCVAMCRAAGAQWIGVADIDQERIHRAIEFGADAGFDLREGDGQLRERVRLETGGKGVPLVFDVSGAPDAMELGLDLLSVGGVAVWAGAVFQTRPISLDPERLIRRMTTIRGLHNYNFDDFQSAVVFMERYHNQFPFAKVVSKEFSLQSVQDAFAYAIVHKPLRVGIRI